MQNIYNKLNNHEYLNYNDFSKFIYAYSKSKITTQVVNLEDYGANSPIGYNLSTKNILIDNNYKNCILNNVINSSIVENKDEQNFIVDLYNIYSLTCLLHELRHAEQLEDTYKNSPKFKLIKENYNFLKIKPKLYYKNHDLYYFEYDALITSLVETLNIINNCKNINLNSIKEYNKLMTTMIYHSYGNKYCNENTSINYSLFSSPISYSLYLLRILYNKYDRKKVENWINNILDESSDEYSKLLNGCKLSKETMILLRDISFGLKDTYNILNDIKAIDFINDFKTYKLK